MNRAWLLAREARATTVQTWCRVCGRAAILKIASDYARATVMAYRLEDAAMDHDEHAEVGGWGVHWRLDDVLRLVFPFEHRHDVFTIPSWYPYDINFSLELPVRRLSASQAQAGGISTLQARIEDRINDPMPSRELLEEEGEVWDEEGLHEEFKVISRHHPALVVQRRSDGTRGRLFFQRDPKLYFGFQEENP